MKMEKMKKRIEEEFPGARVLETNMKLESGAITAGYAVIEPIQANVQLENSAVVSYFIPCESLYPYTVEETMKRLREVLYLHSISNPVTLYEETWSDADLLQIMEEMEVPPTYDNLVKARKAAGEYFDSLSLSDRNDAITSCLEKVFDV